MASLMSSRSVVFVARMNASRPAIPLADRLETICSTSLNATRGSAAPGFALAYSVSFAPILVYTPCATSLRLASFISVPLPYAAAMRLDSHEPKSLVASGRNPSAADFATGASVLDMARLIPRPAFSDAYSTRACPKAIALALFMRSSSPVMSACAWIPSCPRTVKSHGEWPDAAAATGHRGTWAPSCMAPRTGASMNAYFMASFSAAILPPRAVSLRASVPTPPNIDRSQRSMPSSAPSANQRANLRPALAPNHEPPYWSSRLLRA